MPPITHVFVEVPKPTEKDPAERLVPIPANEATAAGGEQLRCVPGKIYRLPYSSFTRRRITAGDLSLVNKGGTKVKVLKDADASGFVRLEPDGTVSKDQRTDEQVAKEDAEKAAAAKAKADASAKAAGQSTTPAKDA
jgi:hypothetical protein